MIIIVEKNIGRATSAILFTVEVGSSFLEGSFSRSFSTVSAITIDASTRIPKSIAPMDRRLAGMSVSHMRINAIMSENGIANATTNALRGFPRKIIRIAMTSIIPKTNVWATV